jgi:hypothetical protein
MGRHFSTRMQCKRLREPGKQLPLPSPQRDTACRVSLQAVSFCSVAIYGATFQQVLQNLSVSWHRKKPSQAPSLYETVIVS